MKRWILTFDAGCSACADVIDRVRAVAGPTLEVCSLSDPQIREMRETAFGGAAPWTPTLLAVDGRQARAWTGPALSLRLAWILGPARSVRVVRSISSARGIDVAVASPGRRRLLRAVPGVAAVALVVSGGGGTAWAAVIGPAKKKVPVLEAAKQTFGIDPADTKLVPNTRTAAEVVARSTASPGVTALAAPLRKTGLQVLEPTAYTVDQPLRISGRTLPTIDVTHYGLRGAEGVVGQIIQLTGPRGNLAVSVARRPDGTTDLLAHDSSHGLRERVVIGTGGQVLEGPVGAPDVLVPGSISCQDICGVLCDAWWGLGLPGCIAACAASGPADPICAALCGLIVAGVCNLFGCNVLCCSCCGQC